MSIVVGLLLPVLLVVLAIWMARRELSVYKDSDDFGSDLFVYTKGRLYRRLSGCGLLGLTGLTLAAFELFPAQTVNGFSIYLALLCVEVLGMLVLPLVDLWETGTGADPADLTRQGDPDRRTRSRPDRPQ